MLRGKFLNHMCNTLTTSCPVKDGLNCGSLPKASKCIEPFFFPLVYFIWGYRVGLLKKILCHHYQDNLSYTSGSLLTPPTQTE